MAERATFATLKTKLADAVTAANAWFDDVDDDLTGQTKGLHKGATLVDNIEKLAKLVTDWETQQNDTDPTNLFVNEVA